MKPTCLISTCLAILVGLSLGSSDLVAAQTEASPTSDPVDYALVVTGGELLEGVYPDGHTAFITRTLRPLGCRCVASVSVGDDREAMLWALHAAGERSKLTIVTGGLGPTANDLTREVISEFTGIPLKEDPGVVSTMGRRFGTPVDQLRSNLRRQAQVPARGTYLENPRGSAVGLVFESDNRVVVALPGPPRELQPMVQDQLVPYLARRYGIRTLGSTVTLRFVGVGQSQIDETLRQHELVPEDVVVSSLFDGSRVDFTFGLPGSTDHDRERLRQLGGQLRQLLSDHWYADGDITLEQAVADSLRAAGGGLVFVEIGSAGRVASALSTAGDIDSVMRGAFVAPTQVAMSRLMNLSLGEPEDAPDAAMAWLQRVSVLAAHQTSARWFLVVGEPLRTSGSPETLTVGFGEQGKPLATTTVRWSGPGDAAQAGSTTRILDFMRRSLSSGK